MAKMTFKAGDEYAIKLSRLATDSGEIAKKAIYAGAEVVADKIKENVKSLPEDKFRYLRGEEKFKGVSPQQKKDLLDSFGITPIDQDRGGDWNTKLGFDGYGGGKTKKYPKGLPNQLLARAVESGSVVRIKTPFVRTAVNATKKESQTVMAAVVDEEIEKIMK